MAINVSFNGATIYKPGAYSKTNIDLGGGFNLGPAGLIAVFGEADAGAPGANEINIADNRFGGDQLVSIRNKYRSGAIVDAAAFLFAPAADAAIPSGAQTVWFYKTNASVRSSLGLAGPYATVRANEWGVGGNRITYKNVLISETAPQQTSGAIGAFGAPLNGKSFSVRSNGAASATVVTLSAVPADHNSSATLATEIQTALGAGYVVTAPSISTIKIALAAAPLQYQKGWGRALEMIDSTPGDLASLSLVASLSSAAVEPSATISLNQKRDQLVESAQVGGHVVLTLGRNNSGGVSSATVDIDDTNLTLGENGSPVHILPLASFSVIKDLADEIGLRAGWTASVTNAIYNQLNPSSLDEVVGVEAFHTNVGAEPARIKKDAQEVQDMFSGSSIASLVDEAQVGLPAALSETLLTGGARGASTSADMIAALEKFEKFHVNSVLPLFSRDAADDIADGVTDSASTYTIDGINQAVKTHLSLMKTTKRRSERQGYLSYRASYSNCKVAAGNLADGRIQLSIQDIRQVDSQGAIKWFQPWGMAALLAGARGGSPIGTPLTHKFLNASGIRQTAQPLSTPEQDIVTDFDPDLQGDDAIQSGITFMEAPQTGGFRVVVDNTTYGRDDNFVFNRANVLYAADIVAFNFRNSMEAVFVGQKNTISVADVVGVATQVLTTFLAQGITVATADAPQGFKSLVVRIVGSIIYIEVTIKIVEGIDFVLADITIQRAISG